MVRWCECESNPTSPTHTPTTPPHEKQPNHNPHPRCEAGTRRLPQKTYSTRDGQDTHELELAKERIFRGLQPSSDLLLDPAL